jgi:hypothetical protein
MNRARNVRLILGLVVSFALLANAPAPSITVLMPNSSTNLEKGIMTPITWKYTSVPDNARGKVVLLKDGVEVAEIAVNVPIIQAPMQPGWGALPDKWKVGDYIGGSVQPD